MTYGAYAPFFNGFGNQTQGGNDLIWVQGEAGARAYMVAPGRTVVLWDAEAATLYVKTADTNGMPSMRILDFTERPLNAPKTPNSGVCECGDKFATKEDVNALTAKIDEMAAKYEALSVKKAKSKGEVE